MKPVICIHGLQGSGKSYLINYIKNDILKNIDTKEINIKSTFIPLVNMICKFYESMGRKLTEAQCKKLMLNESTYGEMVVDKNIWTDEWKKSISLFPHSIILVDDIRTTFNLDGLLSLNRPVILFKLDVSEDIRRYRLGDKWRDNGGYTEELLKKPEELPENFKWIELGSDWKKGDIVSIMESCLYEGR